jgi:hypothetical protein
MTRLLIALLALLGFAAQLSPAEARIRAPGSSQVGVVADAAAGEHVAVAGVTALAARPAATRRDDRAAVAALPRGGRFVPTVMLGSDRARE